MATKTGQDTYVWFIDEATYGTAPTSGTYSPLEEIISISGRGAAQERGNLRRHGSRQRVGRPALRIDEDNLVVEVNLTEDMYDEFILGFDETVASSGSRAIVVADNATFGSASAIEVYEGCVQDTVEISIDNEGVVTATFEFIRQKSEYFASAAASGLSGATFTAHGTAGNATFLLFTDITLDKASFTNDDSINTIAHEINISVSQNGEKKYRINGNAFPTGVHFGNFDATASVIIDYDDLDEFAEITGGDQGSIVVTLGSWGTATLNNVTFDSAYLDSAPNELITIDIPMTADTVDFA